VPSVARAGFHMRIFLLRKRPPASAPRGPRRSRWHPRRIVRHGLIAVIAILAGLQLNAMRLGRPIYQANFRVPRVVERMPDPVAGQKIVVFAPHEDDEAIGCATYMHRAVAVGADVHVVLLTNGDATELSVLYDEKTLRRRPKEFLYLGRKRQRETLEAMRAVGIAPDHVIFLGYPNNGLDRLWSPQFWYAGNPFRSPYTKAAFSPYENSYTPRTPYCGEAMVSDIRKVLMSLQPDTVFTVMPADIHRDHWPEWCFVVRAIAEVQQLQMPYRGPECVFTYLVHWPHWPAPRSYHPASPLCPPAALRAIPYMRWMQLPATPQEVVDKHRTISTYRTQGGRWTPVVTSFARTDELFAAIEPAGIRERPAVAPAPGQGLAHPDVETLIEDIAPGREKTLITPEYEVSQVSGVLDPRSLWLEVQTKRALPAGAAVAVTVVPCTWTDAGSVGPIVVKCTRSGVINVTRTVGGKTRQELPASIAFGIDDPIITLAMPREWLANTPAFILSADVYSGNHLIDRAIWRLVYITAPRDADDPLPPPGSVANTVER